MRSEQMTALAPRARADRARREASLPRCFLYAVDPSAPLAEIAERLAEHIRRFRFPCRVRATTAAPPDPLAAGWCLTSEASDRDCDLPLATDVVVLVTLVTMGSPMRACARVRLLSPWRGSAPVWLLGVRGQTTGPCARSRTALCEEVRRACGVEACWLGDIPSDRAPGGVGITVALAQRLASLLTSDQSWQRRPRALRAGLGAGSGVGGRLLQRGGQGGF